MKILLLFLVIMLGIPSVHALKVLPSLQFGVNSMEGEILQRATLSLSSHVLSVPGVGDLTIRMLQNSVPAPTIRLRRCGVYQIELRNQLEANSALVWPRAMNRPSDPNSTNLHLHGLHVSPAAGGDDVLRSVEPGETATYTYRVPCDHSGGSFLYHPHRHGSVSVQVGGGAAGLLIVEDDDADQLPAALRAMPEQHIVVQHVDPLRLTQLAFESGDHLFSLRLPPAPAPGVAVDNPKPFFLVNGELLPLISLPQGQWQRWRVLYVSLEQGAVVTLASDSAAGSSSAAECELQLLAKDGVYLDPAPRPVSGLDLSLASRADVLVRCARAGQAELRVGGKAVAKIEVQPSAAPPQPALAPFRPCRPWYLTSLLDSSLAARGEALAAAPLPIWLGDVSVGGHRWSHAAAADDASAAAAGGASMGTSTEYAVAWHLRADRVYQWDVLNSGHHPLHLHTFHFQLQDASPPNRPETPGYHAQGDWLDVLSLTATQQQQQQPVSSSVRFRTSRFGGPVVAHCHNLPHEEAGAMALAWVHGGVNSSSDRVGSAAPENQQCPLPQAARDFGLELPERVVPPSSAACSCDAACTLVGDCCPASQGCSLTSPPLPGAVCADRVLTWPELRLHNRLDDLWLAIGGRVFNLTRFLHQHPGGWQPYVTHAGKDASELFGRQRAHHFLDPARFALCVGTIAGTDDTAFVPGVFPPGLDAAIAEWEEQRHADAKAARECAGKAAPAPAPAPAAPLEEPAEPDWDFLIVGSGSAGSALAFQLSSHPAIRVLLIEEGGMARWPDRGPAGIWRAGDWLPTLDHPEVRRPFRTLPQPGLNNRTFRYARARVAGGCSAMNAHVLIHMSALDWRDWEQDGFAREWSWLNISSLGRVVHERYRATVNDDLPGDPDLPPLMRMCDELGMRRLDHPNPLRHKGCHFRRHTDRRQWAWDTELGEQPPRDHAGRPGDWWLKRQTAFSQFVEPELASRPNLRVMTETRVRRVLFASASGSGPGPHSVPRAIGVECEDVWSRRRFNLTAAREVILSAGVFNSPQLLMLSGIGDRSHLRQMGVPLVAHLPGVGENLRDDGFCILAGPLLKPEFVRTDAPRSKWAVPGNHMWFPDDGRDDEMPRFSAGMMFGKLWYGSHDKLGEWAPMVFIEPLAQESLGTVRLRSLDAGDLVDIDARTHSHPADRVRYLEAMRQALRMFETPTIRNMTYGGTVDPSPQVVAGGDAALWHWIKQNCDGTNGHPQGTCRMGPREEQAPYGPRNVVDQRLRVYGVSGLRVVDASVHPAPFHGNTNQPVVLVGLRAGTLIMEDWGAKASRQPPPPPPPKPESSTGGDAQPLIEDPPQGSAGYIALWLAVGALSAGAVVLCLRCVKARSSSGSRGLRSGGARSPVARALPQSDADADPELAASQSGVGSAAELQPLPLPRDLYPKVSPLQLGRELDSSSGRDSASAAEPAGMAHSPPAGGAGVNTAGFAPLSN